MFFIDNLTKILEERNITAYKFCKDLELSKNSLNNWKQGSLPTIDKVEKIITYLNIEPYELLNIPKKNNNNYTSEEKEVLNEYRNARPEVQESARLLLRAGKQETKLPTYRTG